MSDSVCKDLKHKNKSSKGVVMMIKAQLKCQIYSQNKCQQDIYWVIKLVEQWPNHSNWKYSHVRISGFSHEGYLISLAGFSLRGEGQNEGKTLAQIVSLDLSQRICLLSWLSLELCLYPRNALVEGLWQHPCMRGGACQSRWCRWWDWGGEWSLDGSVEEGGVLAWGTGIL